MLLITCLPTLAAPSLPPPRGPVGCEGDALLGLFGRTVDDGAFARCATLWGSTAAPAKETGESWTTFTYGLDADPMVSAQFERLGKSSAQVLTELVLLPSYRWAQPTAVQPALAATRGEEATILRVGDALAWVVPGVSAAIRYAPRTATCTGDEIVGLVGRKLSDPLVQRCVFLWGPVTLVDGPAPLSERRYRPGTLYLTSDHIVGAVLTEGWVELPPAISPRARDPRSPSFVDRRPKRIILVEPHTARIAILTATSGGTAPDETQRQILERANFQGIDDAWRTGPTSPRVAMTAADEAELADALQTLDNIDVNKPLPANSLWRTQAPAAPPATTPTASPAVVTLGRYQGRCADAPSCQDGRHTVALDGGDSITLDLVKGKPKRGSEVVLRYKPNATFVEYRGPIDDELRPHGDGVASLVSGETLRGRFVHGDVGVGSAATLTSTASDLARSGPFDPQGAFTGKVRTSRASAEWPAAFGRFEHGVPKGEHTLLACSGCPVVARTSYGKDGKVTSGSDMYGADGPLATLIRKGTLKTAPEPPPSGYQTTVALGRADILALAPRRTIALDTDVDIVGGRVDIQFPAPATTQHKVWLLDPDGRMTDACISVTIQSPTGPALLPERCGGTTMDRGTSSFMFLLTPAGRGATVHVRTGVSKRVHVFAFTEP